MLWVLAYGDFTSGEIHRACERSYYRNQFKNCLAIGQLHALMYRDLAAYFEQVNVLYLAGNHGRRTPKKDYLGANDNWDYLVAEVARLHCRGLANVHFTIPDAWSANIDINGVGFNIAHGDDVRSNRRHALVRHGPPAKGPDRPGCGGRRPAVPVLLRRPPSYGQTLSDIDGELLVNGAWVGTDAFSYNAFAGYREPAQWIHGVNPKHGITWRIECKLQHDERKERPAPIPDRRRPGSRPAAVGGNMPDYYVAYFDEKGKIAAVEFSPSGLQLEFATPQSCTGPRDDFDRLAIDLAERLQETTKRSDGQ